MSRPYELGLKHQSGSITVFFLLFVLIAAGAISYSVYIGRSVEEKIKTHNAADAASFAMAAHGAQGLNMIAANNLAIGASMHVAAAAPIIARYYAIGKAFAVSFPMGSMDMIELYTQGDDSDFADGFGFMAHASSHYMKTASTLTSLNDQIAKYWLIGSIPKGLEQMRLNRPGSIGLPMQASRPVGTVGITEFFHYKYDTLKRTSAKQSMCHAISSSIPTNSSSGLLSGIVSADRNLASAWLRGPIESFGTNGALSSVLSVVEMIEQSAQTIGNIINVPVKALIEVAEGIDDALCSWNLGLNPVCGPIGEIIKTLKALVFPVPQFETCGLNDEGDYSQQIEAFLDDGSSFNKIGFLYPHVTSPAEREQFEKSLSFAIIVGMPLLKKNELPHDANGNMQCPEDWSYEVDGIKQCDLLLGGIELGTSQGAGTGWDSAAGGLSLATRTEEIGQAGGLANAWKRIQWSVSQSRIVYRPDAAAGDPMVNDTRELAPDDPAALNKTRMQMFWPAWQAEATHVSIWRDILSYLRG